MQCCDTQQTRLVTTNHHTALSRALSSAGREVLAGDTEQRQVDLIYKLCGVPDPEGWPGLTRLEAYRMLLPKQKYTPQFKQRFAG